MANVYVWSGATGANSGASWADAFTNLSSISTKAAGDIIFVAHDHNQSNASAQTITSPGTEASPCRIYCVNRAGSVPPVAADLRTTGQVTTTGAFAISCAGSVSECYGIIFNCGTGATSANLSIGTALSRSWRVVNCAFKLLTTNTGSRITFGAQGCLTIVENCTMTISQVGQAAIPAGRVIVRNTTSTTFVQGATIPTVLFASGTIQTSIFLEGVDLSNISTSKNLVQVTTATNTTAILKDCKLGASVTVAYGAFPSFGATDIMLVRCDSGDTNYRTERWNYMGRQTIETTIVKTGGATDGTTPIAWSLFGNAAAIRIPFESLPISVWNETIGSPITITIEGTWTAGIVPTNGDVWMDVYYLGTSGFPPIMRPVPAHGVAVLPSSR